MSLCRRDGSGRPGRARDDGMLQGRTEGEDVVAPGEVDGVHRQEWVQPYCQRMSVRGCVGLQRHSHTGLADRVPALRITRGTLESLTALRRQPVAV